MNAVFTGKAFGFATPWATLSMVLVTDPSLRRLWKDWMKARLRRHRVADAAPELQIVLAADGAWLSFVTTGQARINADLRAVHDRLIERTYRRAYPGPDPPCTGLGGCGLDRDDFVPGFAAAAGGGVSTDTR